MKKFLSLVVFSVLVVVALSTLAAGILGLVRYLAGIKKCAEWSSLDVDPRKERPDAWIEAREAGLFGDCRDTTTEEDCLNGDLGYEEVPDGFEASCVWENNRCLIAIKENPSPPTMETGGTNIIYIIEPFSISGIAENFISDQTSGCANTPGGCDCRLDRTGRNKAEFSCKEFIERRVKP
jgi:hypothetical protein